jgi:hypothetical protein
MTDTIELYTKKLEDQEKKYSKLQNFSDILDNLSSTEDKKKLLWKEIYENALEDREKAKILFNDCYQSMSAATISDHVSAGQVMSKYLERMSKSNDQILKLAELIAHEVEQQEVVSEDELFLKIQGGK